jgi:hypothetical protein
MWSVVSSQQKEVLNETFEHGFPANWTHYHVDSVFVNMAVDSGVLREYQDAVMFGGESRPIILPALDLSTLSSPYLEFDFAMALFNPNIRFSVDYTIDTTWHELLAYSDTTTAITVHQPAALNWRPSTYEKVKIDLSPVANDTNVRLRFVFGYMNAFASGSWYVDNVRVFDNAPTGLKELNKAPSFNLFPNPAKEQFSIQYAGEITQLRLFNLRGETVSNMAHPGVNPTIDVGHLAPGVYIVEVESEGVVTRQRVVLI